MVTPLEDDIYVPGTKIHCFYAVKMGEEYENRYRRHLVDPDIRYHAMQHEELLSCYPEQWVEEVLASCRLDGRGMEENDFEEVEEEAPARGGGSCAVDPALYSMLKDLRKKLSKKLEVPPYVIFQDPSLEAMATIYPVTLDELQNIPGVGAGKAKRYGEEFCKLIKRHCEENEIERPEDLRVRTVANKSKMKVAIIQAVDRKVALDDIALSKGIEFGDLLDEIEAIVYSGTKLNIDYFLDEIMDEDHMLDIYDYFKESTTDKIDDALDELGDDFTEEEVRLVRIKFISEMAN